MTSTVTNDDCTNPNLVEALKSIGLDSYPIDPSSRVILNELFDTKSVAANDIDQTEKTTDSSIPVQQQYILEKYNEEFDDNDDFDGNTKYDTDEKENNRHVISTIKNDDHSSNEFESTVVRLMEQQTKMLLLLHDRMETLNQTIDDHWILQRLQDQQQQRQQQQQYQLPQQNLDQQRGQGYLQRMIHSRTGRQGQQQQQQHRQPITMIPPAPIPMIPPHEQIRRRMQLQREQEQLLREPGAAADAPPQVAVNRLGFLAMYTTMLKRWVQNIDESIQLSKIIQCIKLFIRLYPRHVRPFDFGVVIKVLFMMAILLNRIQRRNANNNREDSTSNDTDSLEYTTKLTAVATIVLVGFLFQNGCFAFLYLFFIKENYIRRILIDDENLDENGQPVIVADVDRQNHQQEAQPPGVAAGAQLDNNQPVPPVAAAAAGGRPAAGGGPQPPNPAVAAPAFGFNWRHTLLGGGIAAVRRRRQQLQPFPPRRGDGGVQPPHPIPANNNNNNNVDDRGAGGVQQPDVVPPQGHAPAVAAVVGNNNNANPFILAIASIGAIVVQILQDFVILFGSFFLSIFPMWKPTPIPDGDNDEEEQEQVEGEDREEDDDDDSDDGDE